MRVVCAWVARHRWLVAGACIVILLVAIGAHGNSAPAVEVAEARVGELLLRIAASGLIESESADLSFQSGGRIVGLYVKEGDVISESQVLARLWQSQAVPGANEVAEVIQAPYAGTVVDVYQRAGSVAAPGVPVLRIASAEPPWVTAFIDVEDAQYVKPGDRFLCRAGGYLSEPWPVVVESVGREAVPRRDLPGSARQVRVRCAVAGGAGRLASGAEVDVDGDVTLAVNALLVPASAVMHDGPDDRMFVERDGVVSLRDVQLGPNNFDRIEVRDGLAAGERVVIYGKEGLTDGMRVRVEAARVPAKSTGGA